MLIEFDRNTVSGTGTWLVSDSCQWSVQISWDILHIDDLVQDCSISSALAMELLQSYTKPSISLSACYYRIA